MKTTNKITDMRGSGYTANSLTIQNDKVYYCGAPIERLIKDETAQSNHIYNIIQFGFNVGSIALTDESKQLIDDTLEPIEFTRINNDTNGNPRYVCHFLSFIGPNDKFTSLEDRYNLALRRSRQLGGRKFHNKQYGGGIVFQMYEGQQLEMSRRIKDIVRKSIPVITE